MFPSFKIDKSWMESESLKKYVSQQKIDFKYTSDHKHLNDSFSSDSDPD